MIKLIYITGYGRSGSTILDILLGQHEQVFGMGELLEMTRHVWAKDEYCACGAQIQECPFWAPTMSDWLSSGVNLEQYLALQKRIELLYSPFRMPGSRTLGHYLRQTESLLEKVADRAGTSVLIDSSKRPGRGLALARSDAIDLRVVHLVRDGRAVAHSMTRAYGVDVKKGLQKELKPRSPYRTALRWRLYNASAEALVRRVGEDRSVRVRYEDVVADPATELQRIGRCVGLDMTNIIGRIASGEALLPGHQMAGSRIRMERRLTLQADKKWESEISEANRRRVRQAAGGQLRRYGYLDQG